MSYDFDDFEETASTKQNDQPAERSNSGDQGGYQKQPYQPNNQGGNQNGYQNKNNGNNDGGYQKKPYQGNGNQSNNAGGGNNYRGGGNSAGGGGGFGGKGAGFVRKEPDPNATVYLPYAVVGNDNPPPHVVEIIKKVGARLDRMGYTCRTGGMKGFEDLFENNTRFKEVHLPWKDFDSKDSKFTYTHQDAKIVAARYQPGFDAMKPFLQSFLAKNVRVLMGKDLRGPALFLITWSEDGAESAKERTSRTGGAGHAIAIAHHLRIPIFNLGKEDSEGRLHSYLTMHEHDLDPQIQR